MCSHPLCRIACALFCIYSIKGWLQTNIHWLRLEPHDSLLALSKPAQPSSRWCRLKLIKWKHSETDLWDSSPSAPMPVENCWHDKTKKTRSEPTEQKLLFTLVWLIHCVHLFQMRPNGSSRTTTHQAQWKTSGTVADLFAGEVFTFFFFFTFFSTNRHNERSQSSAYHCAECKGCKIKTDCCLKYHSGDKKLMLCDATESFFQTPDDFGLTSEQSEHAAGSLQTSVNQYFPLMALMSG